MIERMGGTSAGQLDIDRNAGAVTGALPVTSPTASAPGASRALWTSTAAFTICFAVWTIFSILSLELKALLGLGEAEFGLLTYGPILFRSRPNA
jgi:hypothetical protein